MVSNFQHIDVKSRGTVLFAIAQQCVRRIGGKGVTAVLWILSTRTPPTLAENMDMLNSRPQLFTLLCSPFVRLITSTKMEQCSRFGRSQGAHHTAIPPNEPRGHRGAPNAEGPPSAASALPKTVPLQLLVVCHETEHFINLARIDLCS
jgi:hypothetical protein